MSENDIVSDIRPEEAVERAMHGEITVLERRKEKVVVLPARSPWVNNLLTALKEEKNE